MNENDDLRQLFADATAQIRPQGTLDDIQNRTDKVDPTARRWFLPSLAAAAVMVAVIGGAFYFTRDSSGSSAAPVGSPTSSTTASSTDASTTDAVIFYVGDGARGPRLFAETHQVVTTYHPAPLGAVSAAMIGKPDDADYTSYWPSTAELEGVSFDGVGADGTIEIRLSQDASALPAGVTKEQATAEVNAIVRTAQVSFGNADRAKVEFSYDHQVLTSVLGVPGPSFTGGNDDDVLALVSITSPTNNEKLKPGKLTVTGDAAAFEGTVTWEILVGGDAVIDSGNATARECCTLAPYTFQTNIALEPGTYTLVVHDTDESGAGKPVNRDSKEIIVE